MPCPKGTSRVINMSICDYENGTRTKPQRGLPVSSCLTSLVFSLEEVINALKTRGSSGLVRMALVTLDIRIYGLKNWKVFFGKMLTQNYLLKLTTNSLRFQRGKYELIFQKVASSV